MEAAERAPRARRASETTRPQPPSRAGRPRARSAGFRSRSCRTTRARLAPSETRIPISCPVTSRARAADSRRWRTRSAGSSRMPPSGRRAAAVAPRLSAGSQLAIASVARSIVSAVDRPGCCWSICAAMTSSSARTCSRPTSSFRRPSRFSQRVLGVVIASVARRQQPARAERCQVAGLATVSRCTVPSAATPTTVTRCRFS